MINYINGYEIWVTTTLKKEMYHLGNVVVMSQTVELNFPGFLCAYDENDVLRAVKLDTVQALEVRTLCASPMGDCCGEPNLLQNAINRNIKGGDQDSGPVKATTADKIRDLCGYVENGSDVALHIHQDDATQWWNVAAYSCGKQVFSESAESFEGAVSQAYNKHGGRD